jgi:hypothetical protein
MQKKARAVSQGETIRMLEFLSCAILTFDSNLEFTNQTGA